MRTARFVAGALIGLSFVLVKAVPAQEETPAKPGALTLARTIDQVLARYPTIAAAQAEIDAARSRTTEANADRLPQVEGDATYTALSFRPYIGFGASNFYETARNSYDAAVSVRQLLTDFGRTDALIALARSGELTAKDALEQTRHQLGYQAIQEFYGVLLLRQSVAVADEEVRALEEALRISERKFAGGTATKFDLLTTQVRLAAARNRRTDAYASQVREEAALRQLLGLSAQDPVDLEGDFAAEPPQVPELSGAIAQGLENRPEMKIAHDQADTAQLRVDSADRADRPVLTASASGGLEDNQLPNLYTNRGYVAGGASLSVPIFTGNRTSGEKAEARAELRAAQARIDETTRTVATDVSDALTDLKAAAERLGRADLLVAQAHEALDLARTRYANGVITDFELLDAQSQARSAELSRLQARYDCALAREALARSEGLPPAP